MKLDRIVASLSAVQGVKAICLGGSQSRERPIRIQITT